MESRIEKLFEFMDGRGFFCKKCGESYSCEAVRMGFYGDIIGLYACGCTKNRNNIIYRGCKAAEIQKVKEILGEEFLSELERKQNAACLASISCPYCGNKRRYMESEIRKDGKFLHRFDCRNESCRDFERSIWMELTEEDCEKIFNKAAKKAVCKVCGELIGAKVYCHREKHAICEKHCYGCGFRDDRTSQVRCRFPK